MEVGNTPLIKKEGCFFKLEFCNPTGSVKDRAVWAQLRWLKKVGVAKAGIATSGNAGISASFWGQKLGVKVWVFVSPKINKNKLATLKSLGSKIVISKRAKTACFRWCQKNQAFNLRQSKDPIAWEGFGTIAKELIEQLGRKIGAVFVPVSSGATLWGMSQFFVKNKLPLPQFFAVQPASLAPIAQFFDTNWQPESQHLTDSLVAKTTPLKTQLIKLIKKTKGGGVVVSNQEICRGVAFLQSCGWEVSFEGGLVWAGYQKAKKRGWVKNGPVVCLLTGKRY